MSDGLASLQLASISEELGNFLAAYCASMRSFAWCRSFHYVDAFGTAHRFGNELASPAITGDAFPALAHYCNMHEDHLRFLRDSPRIAFEQSDFHSYTFIDPCGDRELLVNALAREFTWQKYRTIRDSCSKFLRNLARRVPSNSQRAILFLDPFSMRVNWDTIHSLAQSRAVDVVMNFPIGIALQRIFPLQLSKLHASNRVCFDQFFGATEWINVLYDSEPRLGSTQHDRLRATNPGSRLVKWYRDRLALIFAEVSEPFLVRSSSEGQLYYLLVASHRSSTVRLAQDVLQARAS